MKQTHIKIPISGFYLSFIFGLGYWRDDYSKYRHGVSGEVHYIIIPFARIYWGHIYEPL